MLHPVIEPLVRILAQEGAPFGRKFGARGVLRYRLGRGSGQNEVEVRVRQLTHFQACWAVAAAIGGIVGAVLAVEVLRVSQRERKRGRAFAAPKELGVRHVPTLHRLAQDFLKGDLIRDIGELHF